jgi:cold shock CspA family protein
MLELLIVEAELKWFSRRKDFGFLVPTHESLRLGDILISGDVIRQSPGMTTEPGTKVRCSVASAAGRGLRAVAVQEVVLPVRFSRFLRATVKWYRRDFGFLVASGHPDIFIHASVLKRAGMPPLTQDDQILVRVADDEHGRLRAVAVRPVPPTSAC